MTSVSPPWPLRYLSLTLTIALLAALGLLYLLAGGVRAEVNAVVSLMIAGNIAGIRDYILGHGMWAPVVSLLLMVLQALVAPIPASLIMFANGLAFGTINGALISLLGQLLASLVCFGLARAVGRTLVERLVSKQALTIADRWFARWGMLGIIGLRMIPGPGFDAVSYASGLTRIGIGPFLLATGIGSLPQIVLYAFLGDRAPEHLGTLIVVTVVILAGIGLVTLIRSRRRGLTATPTVSRDDDPAPVARPADQERVFSESPEMTSAR
ncbi:MAG: TVP38/TMEM64 family protein [Chloroflexota bacterium]|nr:TVP38/TMEM64 family protein [Chloroflexota bacterium]